MEYYRSVGTCVKWGPAYIQHSWMTGAQMQRLGSEGSLESGNVKIEN